MKVCSVLVPTKGRAHKLREAIRSIEQTTTPGNVEVLCWYDYDEPPLEHDQSQHAIEVRNFIGTEPQKLGYEGLTYYYEMLCIHAEGKWLMFFNDDALVEGPGWDRHLESVPTSGKICQPEFVWLNQSKYRTQQASPFPIVPNKIWMLPTMPGGGTGLPSPVDAGLAIHLQGLGWTTHIVPGMTVRHNRQIDATLPKDRY